MSSEKKLFLVCRYCPADRLRQRVFSLRHVQNAQHHPEKNGLLTHDQVLQNLVHALSSGEARIFANIITPISTDDFLPRLVIINLRNQCALRRALSNVTNDPQDYLACRLEEECTFMVRWTIHGVAPLPSLQTQ